MTENLYNILLYVMPITAVIVFAALFWIKAGYGMFSTSAWGLSMPNRIGWIMMECPVFFVMLWLWITSDTRYDTVPLIFFILFELHYFQRTFVFPFLMKGRSRMPLAIVAMGVLFNIINGFLMGESLFHLAPDGKYCNEWLTSPAFICGTVIFFIGMAVNLHSDNVIRHLRKPGDTNHYLPQKGMYRYVTSGNYFGELVEWTGFAILTQSYAAWIFVIWTFANLAPRAHAIRRQYRKEFGTDAVGSRKCLIPYIY